MEEKRGIVAKRTGAQINCQFKEMIDEYYGKKHKEKKEESERAHDS